MPNTDTAQSDLLDSLSLIVLISPEWKLPAEDAAIIRNKESIREVNIGWQTTIAGIPYRRGDSCCYIDKNATAKHAIKRTALSAWFQRITALLGDSLRNQLRHNLFKVLVLSKTFGTKG